MTTAKATLAGTRLLVAASTTCVILSAATSAQAQDIEPRAYSNAPVGVNFLFGTAWQHRWGGGL